LSVSAHTPCWCLKTLRFCLQEEQRELANTIRVSGSILLSTVSNFLDFFKLEAVSVADAACETEAWAPWLVINASCTCVGNMPMACCKHGGMHV
jgi:hypothetical protein